MDAALDGVAVLLVEPADALTPLDDLATALLRRGAVRVERIDGLASAATNLAERGSVLVARGIAAIAGRPAPVEPRDTLAVICGGGTMPAALHRPSFVVRVATSLGPPPEAALVAPPGVAAEPAAAAGPAVPDTFRAVDADRNARRAALGLPAGRLALIDADAALPTRDVLRAVAASGVAAVVYQGGCDPATVRLHAQLAGVTVPLFADPAMLADVALAADVAVVSAASGRLWHYLAAGCPALVVEGPAALPAGASAAPAATLGDALARVAIDDPARQAARAAAAFSTADAIADAVAGVWARRHTLAPPPPPPAPAAPRFETIGAAAPTALARDAARERLAAIILEERRLTAEVASLGGDRDRWLRRLSLADDSGDRVLAALAGDHVRAATSAIAQRSTQLDALHREKETIRQSALASPAAGGGAGAAAPMAGAAGAAGAADVEAKFRALERAADLERLRRGGGQ